MKSWICQCWNHWLNRHVVVSGRLLINHKLRTCQMFQPQLWCIIATNNEKRLVQNHPDSFWCGKDRSLSPCDSPPFSAAMDELIQRMTEKQLSQFSCRSQSRIINSKSYFERGLLDVFILWDKLISYEPLKSTHNFRRQESSIMPMSCSQMVLQKYFCTMHIFACMWSLKRGKRHGKSKL